MRYLAFDPAKTIGLASWDGVSDTPRLWRTTAVGWDRSAGEMVERLRCFLGKTLRDEQPDRVGIEGGIFAGHSDGLTMARQAQVVGMIEWACHVKEIPFDTIGQSSWRKSFVGFGKMPKGTDEDVEWKHLSMLRCRLLGWDAHGDHNEADAAGILHHLVVKSGVKPPWMPAPFLPLEINMPQHESRNGRT